MTGKACFKNGNNLKGGNEPIHPTGNEKRSDKPSGQKGMPDEFLVQWRSERGGGCSPIIQLGTYIGCGQINQNNMCRKTAIGGIQTKQLALGIPKYLHATVLVYIRKCKCIYA